MQVEGLMMANPAELPRGNGRVHQGGISRLSAIAPTRVQHEGPQVNTFKSAFALDSAQPEKLSAQYNRDGLEKVVTPAQAGGQA
jgi:hypothetical protein